MHIEHNLVVVERLDHHCGDGLISWLANNGYDKGGFRSECGRLFQIRRPAAQKRSVVESGRRSRNLDCSVVWQIIGSLEAP